MGMSVEAEVAQHWLLRVWQTNHCQNCPVLNLLLISPNATRLLIRQQGVFCLIVTEELDLKILFAQISRWWPKNKPFYWPLTSHLCSIVSNYHYYPLFRSYWPSYRSYLVCLLMFSVMFCFSWRRTGTIANMIATNICLLILTTSN